MKKTFMISLITIAFLLQPYSVAQEEDWREGVTDADRQILQEILQKRGAVEVSWSFLVKDPAVHAIREGSNLGMQIQIVNKLGVAITDVRLYVTFCPLGTKEHDGTARAFPLPLMPVNENGHAGWRLIRLERIAASDKVQLSYEPLHLFKSRQIEIYYDLKYNIEGPGGPPNFCSKLQPPIQVFAVTRK